MFLSRKAFKLKNLFHYYFIKRAEKESHHFEQTFQGLNINVTLARSEIIGSPIFFTLAPGLRSKMMRSSSPVSRVWTNCILTSAQHCTSAIITEQPSSISNISLSRCTLYRQKVAFYASKPTIFLHIHRPLYTVCMSHMINSERDVCETVVERLSAVETELWDRRRGFHFTKWFNTF